VEGSSITLSRLPNIFNRIEQALRRGVVQTGRLFVGEAESRIFQRAMSRSADEQLLSDRREGSFS
jgi:hypothetical protein